jgi:hypothetical protein
MVLLTAVGCRAPLMVPAFHRLKPDEQAQVDQMWNNMLARPDRLDRELLLDVMLAFSLHEEGVDRATYHAEKDFAGGVVLMDVSYDRQKPLEDWFLVEIRDRQKNVLRKEHYCGEEVWSHYNDLLGGVLSTTRPTAGPAAPPATQPTEIELREQRLEIRYKQIMAATQPMPPSQ